MQEADALYNHYITTRNLTEKLCAPLNPEDYVVQPVVDVSPALWHIGHTTWFFETLVLMPFGRNYNQYDKNFPFLFNSYYESLGKRTLRTDRGNITRPGVAEVYKFRKYVDESIAALLSQKDLPHKALELIELGINHEQQHQELLITDIKYIFGNNPLFPAYIDKDGPLIRSGESAAEAGFLNMDEGIYEIGRSGRGFCYDNELGRHKVYLHSYMIMNRLVTNGEYMEFMVSGGYTDFRLWLSDGWEWVKAHDIKAPLYWHNIDGKWYIYGLYGLAEPQPDAPVSHISYYEAWAYARWKGLRLPTEFEWEAAAMHFCPDIPREANLLDSGLLAPTPLNGGGHQFFGDAWEWTGSSYLAYPYYKQEEGPLGEYNGKFMINQMVLRGGSCATPRSHIRHTYRNFFQTDKRWQYTGIRLAAYQ